jgi:hypothetical protein
LGAHEDGKGGRHEQIERAKGLSNGSKTAMGRSLTGLLRIMKPGPGIPMLWHGLKEKEGIF